MSDVVRVLDLFDRFVASAARHLPDESLATLELAADRLRRRRHFSGLIPIVGLAGGTGSGKSSLFNAITGVEMAETGARRPTTAAPLAMIHSRYASELSRLWDELGVSELEVSDIDVGFVLIDLPDLDSLEPEHRRQVERLLSDLDVVVWVTDPEKYRDRVLHERFLRPLSSHSGRFLFVVNQSDRLAADELLDLLSDFEWVLRQDGYDQPRVLAVSADPPAGPAQGVDDLRAEIAVTAASDSTGERRVLTEISRLLTQVGGDLEPVGFHERWEVVRTNAATAWPRSRDQVVDFVDTIKKEAPELALVDLHSVLANVTGVGSDEVSRTLELTLGRALREALRPRAESRAIAAELRLELPLSS
jgi:hypothetical protein